jgi:hypothetical protein
MNFSTNSLAAISLCAFVAALTGCNAASQQSTITPAMRQANAAASFHSWMMPEARKSDLVYVTDTVKKKVFIYTYRDLKLVGNLSGFTYPASACADVAGDVFITDEGSDDNQIFEYAHSSTSPLSVLNNPPGAAPFACAVDPTTGNLAVTTTDNGNPEGPGSVSIFQGARGTPTNYSALGLYYFYYATYDASGDLFFDTAGQACCFQLSEIAAGQTRIQGSRLAGGFPAYGSVAWDGKYIVAGDPNSTTVYRYPIVGSSVSYRTVQLTNGANIAQFAFKFSGSGKQASATDLIGAQCGTNANTISIWPYPKGGAPEATITGPGCPNGVAFSPANS